MITVKGGKSMKTRKGMRFTLLLGVVAVAALALALFPTSARAQDDDADGFWNTEENDTLLYPYGVNEPPSPYTVDLGRPDLFVIFETYGAGSPMLTWEAVDEKLLLMEDFRGDGGLEVTVHVIDGPQKLPGTGRVITDTIPPQHGVRVTEDTITASGNVLGWCQDGTPNQEDDCTVWPRRIRSVIEYICGANWETNDNCKDQYENYGPELLNRYIEWAMWTSRWFMLCKDKGLPFISQTYSTQRAKTRLIWWKRQIPLHVRRLRKGRERNNGSW
jgi:hypothetical protein